MFLCDSLQDIKVQHSEQSSLKYTVHLYLLLFLTHGSCFVAIFKLFYEYLQTSTYLCYYSYLEYLLLFIYLSAIILSTTTNITFSTNTPVRSPMTFSSLIPLHIIYIINLAESNFYLDQFIFLSLSLTQKLLPEIINIIYFFFFAC